MYDVLGGTRVIEIAEWLFVPCAGVVLADWGADVVKIEHPRTGDPLRGLFNDVFSNNPYNTLLQISNRGKRSIGIDLAHHRGRALLDDLLADADVLITSFTSEARTKLHIEPEEVLERHPRLVYGRGTGYGLQGPRADSGGYDMTSFWARAGVADRITPPGGEPPPMPGNIGDLSSGLALAGAICAALLRRERTGQGGVVDVALYGIGTYLMSQTITAAPFGLAQRYRTTADPHNPVANSYRTRDDRWITLALLQSDKWWPELCTVIGRDDMIRDPRFADHRARDEYCTECVGELAATFGTRTYREWLEALDGFSGPWGPVQTVPEVIEDPQALVNGFVTPVTVDEFTEYLTAATPGQFDGQPVGELGPAPEHGQQTEEILLELGLDWDAIVDLKDAGAIL